MIDKGFGLVYTQVMPCGNFSYCNAFYLMFVGWCPGYQSHTLMQIYHFIHWYFLTGVWLTNHVNVYKYIILCTNSFT